MLRTLYRDQLGLATDLYQLTMAYGYWVSGHADHDAVFHLCFRRSPFQGGYAVACGLSSVHEYLRDFHFASDDLDYLATLRDVRDEPLFPAAFLAYLGEMRFTCDVDAVAEGTPVFPLEPIVRVRGPLIQCQLIETALLNFVNFQTLIATKAARITQATQGEPVMEFGLRRAQGLDGGVSASWASWVGGCAATSNVLAGKLLGIPVKGTHAHSWVMSFDSEPEAFAAYAAALPGNCVFLVDTYDTLQGVRHAVEIGLDLRQRGYEMIGIRLDSGDLAWLSIEARRILDEGGFPDACIVASNDLDEYTIASLKEQHACINVWGVGTRLVTAYDQPALGGVYKLSAIRKPGGEWRHRVKLSEQAAKVSVPGILQIRRFRNDQGFIGDMIYDTLYSVQDAPSIIDPMDPIRTRSFSADDAWDDLLQPMLSAGESVWPTLTARQIQDYAKAQRAMLHPSIRRFVNPHAYPAGLERGLYSYRDAMIMSHRKAAEANAAAGRSATEGTGSSASAGSSASP